MISEMRWRRRIQEKYIGILAGLEAACVRRKVKGSRAVQGEGGRSQDLGRWPAQPRSRHR